MLDLLDLLDRAVEHALLHYRWFFALFFLVPISVAYEVYAFARNWLVLRLNTAPSLHDSRVQYVQRQVREWRADAGERMMCTARPGWQTMSFRQGRYKSTMYNVRVDMYDILEVNVEQKFVRVEPLVTMGQLSRTLNAQGWTIPVLPEIEDLTVGGLVMGTGVESSSHKYGLFQHTCRAYELVLCDGSAVRCTRGERSDLFHAVPWSHGTIGFLVSVEIDIVPARKLVQLHYEPIYELEVLCERFRRASHDASNDFVEAILFSADRGVLMTGHMVDEDQCKRVNAIGRWYKPWFFKHVESKLEDREKSTEYLPLRDYYHRHTRSIFWELQDIVPFGNHPLFRFLLGWTMPPKISFLKCTQTKSIKKLYETAHVIQDVLIPTEELQSAILNFDKLFKLYPLWLCPFKLNSNPGFVHSPTDSDGMYVDVGIYGVPKAADYEAKTSTRKLEQFVRDVRGYQMLYADTYTTRDEFRKMFDHSLYDKVRESLQCKNAFPEVYDKVNKNARV